MLSCTPGEFRLNSNNRFQEVAKKISVILLNGVLLVAMPACASVNLGRDSMPTMVEVTIFPQEPRQTMEGFGASSRVWDDPHVSNAGSTSVPAAAQENVLTLLYTDLGLTRMRPVLDGGVEPINDNVDPAAFDWTKFHFEWKRTDAHISLVEQARAKGMTTFFVSPVTLEAWMTEDNPDEYVEWALAIMLRWRDRGVELPYFSIINEPGYKRSGIWSAEWMRTVVKRLGARMRQEGFRTMLVIPDDLNPAEAYKRASVVLRDSEARRYVGALAYHLYDTKETELAHDLAHMRNLAAEYGIPIWMTEFSVPNDMTFSGAMEWMKIIHKLVATYDVSAVDYMWGFFGAWERNHTILSIEFLDGKYVQHHVGPLYYLTGQFSKFVRPGQVRVETHSSSQDLLVTAYKSGAQSVIVAINAGQEDRRVNVTVTDAVAPLHFSAIRTTVREFWSELEPIASDTSTFNVALPAQSVTTYRGGSIDSAGTLSGVGIKKSAQ